MSNLKEQAHEWIRGKYIISGALPQADKIIQDLLTTVEQLEQVNRNANDMIFAVTAVCNGSSAMEHLDAFRNADAMLQEAEKERFRAALEKIADSYSDLGHGMKKIAKQALAESV